MPRNLVVVVLDTLRHPQWFPGLADGSAMPYLRKVSSEGVAFSNAIASSCWTPPSHVSLLSGTEPWLTHFHVASGTADVPSNPFLGEMWTKRGGTTAAFSANWLVAPQVGTARGYEYFNPGLPLWIANLFLQGVQVVGIEQLLYARVQKLANSDKRSGSGSLDRFLQFTTSAAHEAVRPIYSGVQVVRAVRRFLRRRDRRKPLHLLVNFMEMHEPYVTPPHRSAGGLDLEYLPTVNLARHTLALEHWGSSLDMMEPYAAAGRRLDQALELLIGLLRNDGVLDDASLLIVGDHGQALGENQGSFGHGFFLFDELVRVPAYYFEFKSGQPHLEPTQTSEWVDLRHLFDVLVARGIEERETPISQILTESLDRRGPAASFWEGPAPHPPRGFLLSQPRSSYHRSIRVFGPDGSCSLDDSGHALALGAQPNAPPAQLLQYAKMAIGRSESTAGASTPGPRESEVDRRLRSWGYD
ncbi:MAG: sulfatase-like hydrolase/transferase [Thermoplasmata archaeon]